MELEIKFQNETIEDLERQIINIVRKYVDLKCGHEKNKKRKKMIERKLYIASENEIDFLEKMDNEQLVNSIGIKSGDFDKYY